ncbi:hypothetical protein KDI_23430 [Dictyobacter arantiisoli]|uniref:Uncharacterized protein n=1 Tax=Dictyobacter arantiisoli TaxID=2014874 RepID=A0A5A5TCN8_9CHLR|nr:hypothetical protein KDI_23430 [Dictyobacter arantiisoli]
MLPYPQESHAHCSVSQIEAISNHNNVRTCFKQNDLAYAGGQGTNSQPEVYNKKRTVIGDS